MKKLLGKDVCVYEVMRLSGEDIHRITTGKVTLVEGHILEVAVDSIRIGSSEPIETENLPAVVLFNITASTFSRILLFTKDH